MDVHYHPNGTAQLDRTRIGLHFAKGPVDKRVRIGVVGTQKFAIPANDPHYPVRASGSLPRDITLVSVWPHMHLLGDELKATATLPGGIASPLLWIRDWDPHWQMLYEYLEPKAAEGVADRRGGVLR